MNPGQLNKRIKFYKPSYTTSALGEPVGTYLHEFDRWAKVLSLKEQDIKTHANSEVDLVVVLRYNASIDSDWRVQYREKTFEIKSLDELDNDRFFLQLSLKRIDNLT